MPNPKTLLTTLFLTALTPMAPAAKAQEPAKNVVLVHGAVMDGSGWRAVHDILKQRGFSVSVVQLALRSFDDDVAATRRILEQQNGPVVLVGHSYGGAVISVAGSDARVKSLVYVAALQPDKGESIADLNATRPVESHLKSLGDNFIIVEPSAFHADVAADLPTDQAMFLASSQIPTSIDLFTQRLPAVAWHAKPSFGIVAANDKTVSPDLQRYMYGRSKTKAIEIEASHVVHISHPEAVADVIAQASETM
jgi:pimeloyl-ACP methyl ester carboxylesterase